MKGNTGKIISTFFMILLPLPCGLVCVSSTRDMIKYKLIKYLKKHFTFTFKTSQIEIYSQNFSLCCHFGKLKIFHYYHILAIDRGSRGLKYFSPTLLRVFGCPLLYCNSINLIALKLTFLHYFCS